MKPPSIDKKTMEWQRHFVGMAAVVLGLFAAMASFGWSDSDSSGVWATGIFVKVSIVLAMAWLAWPQLLLLKKMPGGGFAIASVFISIVVFLAKPKLLLYLVPLLVSITALYTAITWIQRNLLPPK